MATFNQSGQRVGIQLNADVVDTDDLRAISRWLETMIAGLEHGRVSDRRSSITRHLKRAYIEAIHAIDAGD